MTTDLVAPAFDALAPWERQPGEPTGAYHAFMHYRDSRGRAGRPSRLAAWRIHKSECEHVDLATLKPRTQVPKRWTIWAQTWGWDERVAAWEAEVDRQARDVWMAEQLSARKRHAQLASETLAVLALPIQAAVDAAKSPDLIAKLVQDTSTVDGVHTLLAVIARMAQVIPAMVTMERLALGLTTEQVAVEDQRDRAFADKIVTDPEATALAVQLLDRVTQAIQPAVSGVLPAHEPSSEMPVTGANGNGSGDADG